jgi:hypothetical protein
VKLVLTRHRIFAALALCTAACSQRAPQAQARCPDDAPAKVEAPASAPPSTVVAEPPRRFRQTKAAKAGAPAIARAHLTAPQVVTLHFSEPVTPDEAFDPQQFRLSVGAHEREKDGYTNTYYYDPLAIDEGAPLGAFVETRVVDEHTLELVLSAPIPSDLCDELQADADATPEAALGLYLHYRDGDTAGIVDADGNHLADIAPHWIERKATIAAYTGTNLPTIEALGPIPCSL